MSTSPRHLVYVAVVVGALAAAPAAAAERVVSTTAELTAAVRTMERTGGTIALRPNAYAPIRIGPRGARWLTIVARPGAQARSVTLDRTRFVRIVGLRVSGRSGDAELAVSASHSVRLERLVLAGWGRLGAHLSVLRSADVVVSESEFTACGEGSATRAGYCVRLVGTRATSLASNRLHDCGGCDFVHGSGNVGLTISRNSFDRAVVGRCGRSVERCHHQDLVHLRDGGDVVIDGNRFGIQEWPGAAQVFLTGDMRGVRITNNLFLATDPRVPRYRVPRALWVGGRVAPAVPRGVVIAHNTILGGARRLLLRAGIYAATSVLLSPRYADLPLADRPLLANNVIGLIRTPGQTCPFVRESVANVVIRGEACSRRDVVARPALGADHRPTAASTALIDRADPRFATPHDLDGRARVRAPDIGAFEYAG